LTNVSSSPNAADFIATSYAVNKRRDRKYLRLVLFNLRKSTSLFSLPGGCRLLIDDMIRLDRLIRAILIEQVMLVRSYLFCRMKIWLIFILLLPLVAEGEVFRSADEEGNVTYSDTATPGAESIHLPGLSTYDPPDYLSNSQSAEDPKSLETAAKYRVAIHRPEQRDDIRSDSGLLEIELDISPALGFSGDKVVFQLDDDEVRSTKISRFSMRRISRGPHRLTVWIADSSGNLLSAKQSVQFSLLRGSDLFHPPAPDGVGPGVQQAPRAPMAPRAPRQDIPRQYTPRPANPVPTPRPSTAG